MRLDITVCYSLLEYCFENLHPFRASAGNFLLEEIKRRRLNIHYDLEEEYANYFEQNRPDLMDSYQNFLNDVILQEENTNFVHNYSTSEDLKLETDLDSYFQILLGVCLNTTNKILLSEILDSCSDKINKMGINLIESKDVIDQKADNILNNYRLPIVRKRVVPNTPSTELSRWFKPILQNETNIQIIDPFIYQNADNFLTYFLNNVKHGSNITIYTLLPWGLSENDIKRKFKNPPFTNWNISEILLFSNRKEQHARNIFTDNYYIEIDKGMRVFGENGFTDQADITICHKTDIRDTSMPSCQKVV